jgi:PilX N-terminal
MSVTPALSSHAGHHRPQRGAASLLVVMVLFFAISLVAAYTGRNLIYEQRTSANQYRSTLAFEAADAGIEWATAQMNEARMSDDCVPLASAGAVTTQPTFRERYVTIDTTTGRIAEVANRLAGCVFNGSDWVCHCPAAGEPNLAAVATTGNGPFPAFWVKFELPDPTKPANLQPPGVIAARVNACTRNDPACLRFTREAQSGDGVASTWVALALKSALLTPPAAAITARGAITTADKTAFPSSLFLLTNTDRASGGFTMISGTAISTFNSNLSVLTIPGSPDTDSILNPDPTARYPDLSLPSSTPANVAANQGADRMFVSLFGNWPSAYNAQPAVNLIVCITACTSAQVTSALRLKPGRAVVLTGVGGLVMDANLGSPTEPVLLISEGPVGASAAGVTVYGMVYVRAAAWATSGTAIFEGAVVTEGSLLFAGNQTITYNPAVLSRLQRSLGSFVRIPGGWRDFQP